MSTEEFGFLIGRGGLAATNEAFFTISDDGTLTRYTGTQTIIAIPSMVNGVWVVSIGERAFHRNGGLTSVTIPNGVRIIGRDAFSWNDRLTNVIIPNSVRSIHENAFHVNTGAGISLTSITIGANVEIGRRAFSNFHRDLFAPFYDQNGRRAGTYRANHDQWGSFSSWTFSPR
jgi:hypothetical protein